ncbi:VWA domain-containing protein [archaeon]|nr:MAG: VWA domain-containing protein [archaeon]
MVQSASPVATSRRFTQQTSFSSATEDPSLAEEDIIIVETAPAAPTSVSAAALPGLHLSVTPELSAVSTEEVRGFYSQVHVAFPHELANMSKKSHLDIVCIIDNSGSMGGSKIEHLKRAMEFVVGVLGDKDRLSVVTFNSSATLVHGLKAMTAANKALSKGYINRIHATGGTNIFDGMQKGWQVLERRQLRNTSSCVFLLTDGQDQSNLEQKKDLARAIRSSGSSLFLFGFGSDHDSAHMQTIANAAEGSFIYIDTNDTVVDAFGGAIGTQQGCILRHVRVDVTVPAGVRIESLQTGRYGSTVSPDGSSASVQYIDLFGGEQRDFLVLTTLPAVAAPVDRYQVLETEGSYRLQTTDSAAQSSRPAQGFIKRLPPDELKGLAQERHVQVDSHIVRIATTESLERALVMADQGNIAGASDLLMSAQERLRASPSFRAGIEVSVQLEQELKNALQGLVSRETYVTSRAMIQETSSGYGAQRVAYAKMAQSPYQSASSASMQGRAKASKGPPK